MQHGAFQGRQLGQAFATWTRMIDRGHMIALGLAGSLASAGLWPLITWLVRQGYVDVLVSDLGERDGGSPRAPRRAVLPG